MELRVLDVTVPRFERAYVWVRLVKVWASMRGDDHKHLPPEEIIFQKDSGMEATLTQTKTTGPGKKVSAVKVFVAPGAYLVSPRWLRTGIQLWKGRKMRSARGYSRSHGLLDRTWLSFCISRTGPRYFLLPTQFLLCTNLLVCQCSSDAC